VVVTDRLKLNGDKTDALLVSSKDSVRKKNISSMPLMVGDAPISPSPVVLNLGEPWTPILLWNRR
jgi:hypothetical protein